MAGKMKLKKGERAALRAAAAIPAVGDPAEGYPESHMVEAANRGFVAVVKFCIEERGADVGYRDDNAFYAAADNGHWDVVRYLVGERGVDPLAAGGRALFLAAEDEDLSMLKYLIEEGGADPHFQDEEALCSAAACGRLAAVEYLIGVHGADPHARNEEPLCAAARHGRLDVVKYLVERHGADVRARDDAALADAATFDELEVLTYLAKVVFDRNRWRGKSRKEIEAEAVRLERRLDPPDDDPVSLEIAKAAKWALAEQALLTIFALRADWAKANPIKIVPPGKPEPL